MLTEQALEVLMTEKSIVEASLEQLENETDADPQQIEYLKLRLAAAKHNITQYCRRPRTAEKYLKIIKAQLS